MLRSPGERCENTFLPAPAGFGHSAERGTGRRYFPRTGRSRQRLGSFVGGRTGTRSQDSGEIRKVIRYLITDDSAAANEQLWRDRLDTTVDMIQIREPGLSARHLAEMTRQILPGTNARVLINDRADVALAVGAHGIHLKSDSPKVREFRRITPKGFLISVACHSVEEVKQAAGEGADYALLGPIFPPRSKTDLRTPLGVAVLEQATRCGIPVLALGGITEENAPLCANAGAAGVAGISLFQGTGSR